ncbi:MAG TPA: DUF2064 domain-containing protein [Pseudonocardia sp.]|jgi:hypothetical protein
MIADGAATPAALLVLAKAPAAGRAKTRLCPPATPSGAARVAAAALLDTLDTVRAVTEGGTAAAGPAVTGLVAWTGELAEAEYAAELDRALRGIARFAQREGTLGRRIAAAHAEVATRLPGSAVLQIGMDTPQLTAGHLADGLSLLTAAGGPDAVLGPAVDGGWWALGLRAPRAAAVIESVPTSRADTGERTLHALRAAGLTVALLDELRDVDTADDARAVAAAGAGRRFTSEVAEVLHPPAGLAP